MEVFAISVLLLLVFAVLTSSRSTKPQVIYVVERSSYHPNGCLILLVLAIVTFLAVSRF